MATLHPQRDRARPLVLIVDDYADSADLVAAILQAEGYDTLIEGDGLQAMATAIAVRPDVVLLDRTLPGLGGFEVARRLQGLPATRGVRLIAFTACARAEVEVEAAAAGFDGLLCKPVDLRVLVDEVERVLGRRGRPAPAPAPLPPR